MIDHQLWSDLYTPTAFNQSFMMAAASEQTFDQQSPQAEPLRSSTGGSSSSNESTNDIIPGGPFEGFEAKRNGKHVPSPLSLGPIGNLQSLVNYPQTPHKSTGADLYSASANASPHSGSLPHYVPSQSSDGGVGSAIRNIGTMRISMTSPLASAPASYSPLRQSPLTMPAMQPSAFRIPMTPTALHQSSDDMIAGTNQAGHQMFSSPQSIIHFTPGPPRELYAAQSGSLSTTLQGQPRGLPSSAVAPASYTSAGRNSSGTTGQTTFAGSSAFGYPSTPIQQQVSPVLGYDNHALSPVKVENVDTFAGYPTTTQYSAGHQLHYAVPLSGGSVRNHLLPRQYHPYRSPQSEPANRVAFSSSRQFPPPAPPSFTLGQSHVRPTLNASPMSAQPRDLFSVPASDSGTHITSKHYHTGSLEFAIPATPAAYRSRAPARPPFTQSMSLPNHTDLTYPASPEGQSVQTESDDFDEDGMGMSRSPQMVTPAFGGFGYQQSSKSPKRHVWWVDEGFGTDNESVD